VEGPKDQEEFRNVGGLISEYWKSYSTLLEDQQKGKGPYYPMLCPKTHARMSSAFAECRIQVDYITAYTEKSKIGKKWGRMAPHYATWWKNVPRNPDGTSEEDEVEAGDDSDDGDLDEA
jgi:hypothetical protein